jgi:hypothetical protein
MLRLTMVDDPTSIPSDTEEAARAAAIAAMGYRLAAAGPRTRQRLLDRQVEEDLPEESFSLSPAMLRRLAVIGAAGACSFGLVLAAQGRHWDFLPPAEPPTTIIAQADQARASAPPIVSALDAPPTLTAAATQDDHQQLAAAEPPATRTLPATPKTPVRSSIPAKPAHAVADIPHTHLHLVAARTEPVAPKQTDAKPHVLPHPAAMAHYELPHWLTDYHPAPKHVLVMSEPPHDLVQPPSAEHHTITADSAPPPQPSPRQYASAAPAPRPMPTLRPPYGYGYGYSGPYAYGAPAYYPYAPPPQPYYYQRW